MRVATVGDDCRRPEMHLSGVLVANNRWGMSRQKHRGMDIRGERVSFLTSATEVVKNGPSLPKD